MNIPKINGISLKRSIKPSANHLKPYANHLKPYAN